MLAQKRNQLIKARIDALEEQALLNELDYLMLKAAGKDEEAAEAKERMEECQKGLIALEAFKAERGSPKPAHSRG